MKILHWLSEKTHQLVTKVRAWHHRIPLPVRIILAAVFFVLGIAGLFLPVLQGGLFLFIAFWLLFPNQSEQWLEKFKAWFAKMKNSPRIRKISARLAREDRNDETGK